MKVTKTMEKITKTVYSLYYPETDKTLKKIFKESPTFLYEKSYVGSTQENMHLDFKDAWLKWVKPVVTMNENLNHFYATAGSSEAIRESIAQYSHKKYTGHRLHMFKGDYEGYSEFAKSYNIPVVLHDRSNLNTLMGIQSGERFYLSQPSSIDGNVWSQFPEFISILEQFSPGCEVMVDLCYVGAVAKDYQVDLSSKVVNTVFFSLSKVFGVYYQRIGGVFSKSEIPGLYGNRWFKNVLSLYIGIKLMTKYSVQELPKKYLKFQDKSVKDINKKYQSNFVLADVIMLINSKLDSKLAHNYQRENGARICITPILDEAINEKP